MAEHKLPILADISTFRRRARPGLLDAVGVRINASPITEERVLAARRNP